MASVQFQRSETHDEAIHRLALGARERGIHALRHEPTVAAAALPTVAVAETAPADVSALPPAPFDVYILLFGPDGRREYGLVGIAPGVDG